jgi:hypothetical protein
MASQVSAHTSAYPHASPSGTDLPVCPDRPGGLSHLSATFQAAVAQAHAQRYMTLCLVLLGHKDTSLTKRPPERYSESVI